MSDCPLLIHQYNCNWRELLEEQIQKFFVRRIAERLTHGTPTLPSASSGGEERLIDTDHPGISAVKLHLAERTGRHFESVYVVERHTQ